MRTATSHAEILATHELILAPKRSMYDSISPELTKAYEASNEFKVGMLENLDNAALSLN